MFRCVTFSNNRVSTKIVVIRFRKLYSICGTQCSKTGDALLHRGVHRIIQQNSQVLSLRLFQLCRFMQSNCAAISIHKVQGAYLYPACRAWVESQRQATLHHRRLSIGCAPIAGCSRFFLVKEVFLSEIWNDDLKVYIEKDRVSFIL